MYKSWSVFKLIFDDNWNSDSFAFLRCLISAALWGSFCLISQRLLSTHDKEVEMQFPEVFFQTDSVLIASVTENASIRSWWSRVVFKLTDLRIGIFPREIFSHFKKIVTLMIFRLRKKFECRNLFGTLLYMAHLPGYDINLLTQVWTRNRSYVLEDLLEHSHFYHDI